jgi:3-deoxy-D-manno-octulosonic-acid transferase
MKKVWQFIYYFWVNPGIVIGAHILALISQKVRRGLSPRYSTIDKLQKWVENNKSDEKRVLFHAASLGEFEHIRPVLQALKENYQTVNFVTFFSPSGYDNVGQPKGLDFHFYLPFDYPHNWKNIYKIIKPSLIIIAKHDVWPGQVWTAHKHNLPIFLINASLSVNSSRTRWGVKSFLKYVYRDFSKIFAISNEDAERFSIHYPRCKVEMVGDTKYDQVVLRKKIAREQNLLPKRWTENHWIFLAGSTWLEDEENIFPAFIKLLNEEKSLRLVLVPHQPEPKAIARIKETFKTWGVQLFSNLDELKNEKVLIVDAVGYLAGLYHHAHAAYVGGSFQQGIHNVMEPAIFGIPVYYGPVHENSYEAIQLSKDNGGTVVRDNNDLYGEIRIIYNNEEKRIELGNKAEKFATRNAGATSLLLSRWKSILTS